MVPLSQTVNAHEKITTKKKVSLSFSQARPKWQISPPFLILQLVKPPPLIYLNPEKGTPFGWSISVKSFIGFTANPPPPPPPKPSSVAHLLWHVNYLSVDFWGTEEVNINRARLLSFFYALKSDME